MKATGIVRRIDDLGRVVIPKEIRRTMRIREGDPLEIYTNNDGEVIFKKYSPIGELAESALSLCEILWKTTGTPAVITDRDHIVAVSGASKKELIDRKITKELEDLLENRQSYTADDSGAVLLVDSPEKRVLTMSPIISAGDILGSVIFLFDENKKKATEIEIKSAQISALFLSKQMEE